jgi:hypothetical protein
MKAKPSLLESKSARGLMLVASLLINSAESFASTIEADAFVHLGGPIKCLIVNGEICDSFKSSSGMFGIIHVTPFEESVRMDLIHWAAVSNSPASLSALKAATLEMYTHKLGIRAHVIIERTESASKTKNEFTETLTIQFTDYMDAAGEPVTLKSVVTDIPLGTHR